LSLRDADQALSLDGNTFKIKRSVPSPTGRKYIHKCGPFSLEGEGWDEGGYN
jgi:hypothetical protein